MTGSVSHDIRDESMEAKARWFQPLSLEERMDVFVAFTNLILKTIPTCEEKASAAFFRSGAHSFVRDIQTIRED